MSYLIGAGSTKKDRAIRFGQELDRAMRKRGIGRRLVASAIGSSDGSVMYWRTGRMLPRVDTARKLAEALAWPRLVELAIELRRKRCLVDDVAFVDDTGSDNRVYCSTSCQRARQKGLVGSDRRQRAGRAELALARHQKAVAAFCAGCEPSGRCVTPECELRPVSPLALFANREEIDPVRARPRNGYRAPGQQQAITSGVWARYTPEEREARIAKAAEASRRARGLVPA